MLTSCEHSPGLLSGFLPGRISSDALVELPGSKAIDAIRDRTALATALGHTLRADVDALNNTNFHTQNLFGLWVAPGFNDPDHYTAYFMQGGLFLPDRAYYITGSDRMKAIREAYVKHMANMFTLAGYAHPEQRAESVFHLETAIALKHQSLAENEDIHKANNVWKRADFATAVLATHLPSAEAATGLALHIIAALGTTITSNCGEHLVAAAIGIALAPQDGNIAADLLRKADIALYRAKEQGASAMRFFEPAMDAQVRERDGLEQELRKANDAEEIFILYQPLIDLKSGQVRAFEVMPRWIHAGMGEIAPERFTTIAEDSGLIGRLSDSLLAKACTDAQQWQPEVELAFSVSPVLLRDPGLPQRILETTRFPPQRLELEITESALVRDLDAAQRILGRLHEAGVRIALDNFGTGYSSLYHLRNFKLDKIKIDRTFIEAMATDPESNTIVRALAGLGSGLGLEVTAEGVESEEQRQLLITHGCNQAQGTYYGGIVSAEDALCLMDAPVKGL